jgi:hypothetical protein
MGDFPTLTRNTLRSKNQMQHEGCSILMSEKTITLKVYNVYCDYCGAQGPDGLSEADAQIVARQEGWEMIGDTFICPHAKHNALKAMYTFPLETRNEYYAPVDLGVR